MTGDSPPSVGEGPDVDPPHPFDAGPGAVGEAPFSFSRRASSGRSVSRRGEPVDLRFLRALAALGIGDTPTSLLVAFSGGLDSTVLLFLLRFRVPGLPLTITAAHFDHAMRPSSAADAAWVRGLCAAWNVPLIAGIARPGLTGETAAREARYQFLDEARDQAAADYILTAHHADDQAETVLFRILRGTGIDGLAGIPATTPSGVIRPLLGFWRAELESFATGNGLNWRNDPTNLEAGPSRNRLRLEILPAIERDVATAARENLVALADLARESEDGWRAIVRDLYPNVVSRDGETLLVARDPLRTYHPAVASRVVRKALRHFGIVPDRAGTRSVVTFITETPSGRVLELPKGVRVRTEFDRARIERATPLPPDLPLRIPLPAGLDGFRGEARLGGVRYQVYVKRGAGSAVPGGDERWFAKLFLDASAFPLTLRARGPGDRFRTTGGTRPVRKLLIERRIPVGQRGKLPVLVDARGTVVWIAGIGPSAAPIAPGAEPVEIAVRDG